MLFAFLCQQESVLTNHCDVDFDVRVKRRAPAVDTRRLAVERGDNQGTAFIGLQTHPAFACSVLLLPFPVHSGFFLF